MIEWLAGRVGVDAFERPHAAIASLLLAVLALWISRRGTPPAFRWSAWREARIAAGPRRDWLAGLSRGFRLLALLLLGGVLAGPVQLRGSALPSASGLDMMLVVDTSGSMRALDTKSEGEWRTRLDLAVEVVRRFAVHRIGAGDRVGLVVFGETAFTQCPLTSDGRLLGEALGRVRAGMAGEATALGDALTLAVKRFPPAPPHGRVEGPSEGRLVVLLSDGRSNAGAVPPDIAVSVAAARGVRVHSVGIGSQGEAPMAPREGSGARGLRFERHDLDREMLTRIAQETGGLFFHAQRSSELEAVYAEIDALERTSRAPRRRRHPQPRPDPLLALAGLLLLGEVATLRGFARRIP
jgi:Ca-activated chloride channel family protein